MEMYVTGQKEQISEETAKMIKNTFGSLIDAKSSVNINN